MQVVLQESDDFVGVVDHLRRKKTQQQQQNIVVRVDLPSPSWMLLLLLLWFCDSHVREDPKVVSCSQGLVLHNESQSKLDQSQSVNESAQLRSVQGNSTNPSMSSVALVLFHSIQLVDEVTDQFR